MRIATRFAAPACILTLFASGYAVADCFQTLANMACAKMGVIQGEPCGNDIIADGSCADWTTVEEGLQKVGGITNVNCTWQPRKRDPNNPNGCVNDGGEKTLVAECQGACGPSCGGSGGGTDD